ncbi:MAG: DNA translocase FtsK [Mycoplasmatales bacterium]
MKKQNIFKIIIIFLLLISFIGTGSFGQYEREVFLFGFGFLYYWVSFLLILCLVSSMLKRKKYKKKLNKFILILFLACLSIDILITLISSSELLNNEFLLNQAIFTTDNIYDKIGLLQGIIVYTLFKLFSYSGIYITSLILMLIAVFLMLDFDLLIGKISNKVTGKTSKKDKVKVAEAKANKAKVKAEQAKIKKAKLEAKAEQAKIKKAKLEEERIKQDKIKKAKLKEQAEVKSTPTTKKSEEDFKVKVNIPPKTANKNSNNNNKKQEDNAKNTSDLFEMRIPIKGREGANSQEESDVKDTQNLKTIASDAHDTKYQIPSIELLKSINTNDKKYEKLKEEALKKKKSLEEALNSFNVKAKVKNITVGSTITKYELQPESGQKVNKFQTLSNDLAMALAAPSVRIEAPIPGKSLVGIEIPNTEKLMVGLKEIIKANKDKKNKLKVALGQDIEGNAKFLEIDKTPHLLIAGATGSGKSVCINSIITSILLQATPQEVKFLLVDPKKVELTPYEGIPHLLAPVITDAEKATIALNKLVQEMEHRYELFTETKTRNIISYNKAKNKAEKLPYIVAIIDELADLMMVASNDIEASISRIAQKARAAGIHLILATQRPSTDVITGLIKSNIPSRISFMVSSSIDSRTILDSKGAEKLLGHGDMLLSRVGKSGFERIQGGYLSDEEIQKVVTKITEQIKDEKIDDYYKQDFVKLEVEKKEVTEEVEDPLEQEAVQLGIEAEKISTSLLQRKLKIGYNRAANIIEALENKGYVTKPEGNKARQIIKERVNNAEDKS